MKAILRSTRITSKKLNLIADLIRRKNVNEATGILKFTPKKGAKILEKVLKSAVANAENNFKQEKPSLFIKEIIVTEGATMKRSVPVSRGRMNPILKRTAHVTIILGVKSDEINSEKKSKTAQSKEEKSTKGKVSKEKKTPSVKSQKGIKKEMAPKKKKTQSKA